MGKLWHDQSQLHAVPTQDSDAWRKLKYALKVETIPDFVHVRQMLLKVRYIFQVPSSISPLDGKIVGMASCFRK